MIRTDYTEPTNPESARRFLIELVGALGQGFHPDTPMHDYVEVATGEPTFAPADADRLDAWFNRTVRLIDVYEVATRALDVPDRATADRILAAREGVPTPEYAHVSDAAMIAAAVAPDGQPCLDCGRLVRWIDDDWHHVTTPTACFLARKDER